MKNNVYAKRSKAREEKRRKMEEAGPISARFPGVSSIVVTMQYRKRFAPAMRRILNFLPGSHAFFKFNCLGEGCEDGGLDMTRVVTSMVRNHDTSAKGTILCSNSDTAAVHADMSYKIAIAYI